MTPTKELTQPTEAVTREVTAEIISATKTPPLQSSETLNKANTKPNKSDNDEQQNQRIAGNSTDKGTDPRYTSRDKRTNISNDSGDRTNSRSGR